MAEPQLLLQLRKDSLNARKEKKSIEATLLSTLIAETVMVGKNDGNRDVTEDEVLAVIKKFLKGIDESIVTLDKGGRDTAKEKEEKAILEAYMPSQLSEADLEKAIVEIVSGLTDKTPKAMGQVMAALKEQYPNQFDGKIASQLTRKVLA
jgi:hypothetical protein